MVKLSDFSKTCRLCSKVYRVEKLVKIFSNRGISLNLKDSINAHLPIKVTENDTMMPKNICMNCIRRLNAANEFLGTVIASDKLFKRLIKKDEERSSNQLGRQEQSDSLSETKIDGKSNDLLPPRTNILEESVDSEKSDLHCSVNTSTDSTDHGMVSSVELRKEEADAIKTISFDTRSEALGSSTSHLEDDLTGTNMKSSSAETENDSLNNSVEQLNGNDAKYINIVPKTSHVVLGNRNCNGNIIINVGSNAVVGGKDHHLKMPIEVLCCSDCNETVKIYSTEERQLFFEYLKQHECKSNTESEKAIRSFGKYKETYGSENIMQERKKELSENNQITKAHGSGKRWPEGDLPADPGPDPTLYENIFEDDVRLDDDFHWPMPKRIRRLHGCTSCEFVTKSALRLKTHKKLHGTSDNRQVSHSTTSCKHCHKRFETINEAKKHERLAHVTFTGKNSLCEYCGIMKPQKTLRDHVLKQHTVESEIDMQECNVCGKSFISPTSLYLHKKIHTIEKQHLCDLCGKAFKQRIAMRRHYMLHFPRAPPKFKCNICEKRVTTRGSLRLHMMRHTGEKPQECPECHMVMRHGLKHHMRLHSDEAPFKCVVCGADFKRRDYVRRHMRKHLNETEHRSLQCNICDHVFDDIKNFLIHHQNIHRNEIFTQIKIYECKICSMQFADALQHKDHEEVCISTDKEPPHKPFINELQSCIMMSHTKLEGIVVHRDGPEHIPSVQPSSYVYSDYKETCEPFVEDRQKDATRHSFAGALSEPRFQSENNATINKHQQTRFKFTEDSSILKKQHDTQHEHEHVDHVILSEDVISLGTESSEYSYMNIMNKPNSREKDMLMTVDDQIMTSSSVHVFESPVEQFNQSLHSHPQSQLGINPHNETYTRESLSWKQL